MYHTDSKSVIITDNDANVCIKNHLKHNDNLIKPKYLSHYLVLYWLWSAVVLRSNREWAYEKIAVSRVITDPVGTITNKCAMRM